MCICAAPRGSASRRAILPECVANAPAAGRFRRSFHGGDEISDTPFPGLLGKGDPAPAVAERGGRDSPFLLVCDHAGRAIPQALGSLGLPEAAFETHVAWDI